MGRNPEITNEQLVDIYNKYHGFNGENKRSLRSLAPEYGVSQSALSQRLKHFSPPTPEIIDTKEIEQQVEVIEPDYLAADLQTFLEKYSLLIWEYASHNRTTELRIIDSGRFQESMNTLFSTYKKDIIDVLQKKGLLTRGNRGGYILSDPEN